MYLQPIAPLPLPAPACKTQVAAKACLAAVGHPEVAHEPQSGPDGQAHDEHRHHGQHHAAVHGVHLADHDLRCRG